MSPIHTMRTRTFASLRKHRNFRLYFGGQAISFTGYWMQQIAAAWLVLELTGSAVAVGALALAMLLPTTLLGLFVGTVLDRFDVRRTTIVCEVLAGLVAAAFAVLTLGGWVTVWQIYALGVVGGVIAALDGPARHALVFQMVGRGDLPNAVALMSSLGTTARVLGPALGGVVVAYAGPGVAFGVNAATYFVIVGCLLALDTSRLLPVRGDRAATVLGGAADSLRFIGNSRRALVAFVAVFALSTFSFNFNVLLPLVADRTLHSGAQVFGLIAAVFGAGALCGAMVNATVARASLRLLLIGAAGFGFFELLLAPQHSLPIVCVLLFLTGITYTLWGTNALSTIQLEAPEHLRGRAAALYFFAFLGGAPVGGLLCGWLTAQGGTELAFALAGVVALGTAVWGIVRLKRTAGQPRATSATAKAARSTAASSTAPARTKRTRPSSSSASTPRDASASTAPASRSA
jgi:MFS family permease